MFFLRNFSFVIDKSKKCYKYIGTNVVSILQQIKNKAGGVNL